MSKLSQRIIHFRFILDDNNSPVAMREYRALREEIAVANDALDGVTSLRFPSVELSPYGGYTVVVIKNNETNEEWLGVAKCNTEDRFVRKVGVQLALEKANLAMTEGVSNVDEIEFYSNSTPDNRLFEYLRDNELLRDDIVDVITMLRKIDRAWRNERIHSSQEYSDRQAKHAKHLTEQKQRSVQWHKEHN